MSFNNHMVKAPSAVKGKEAGIEMNCSLNWVIKCRQRGLSRKGFIGAVVGSLLGDIGSSRTFVDQRKVE